MPYTSNAFSVSENSIASIMREAPSLIKRIGERMKFDVPRLVEDAEYGKMQIYFENGPEDSELRKAQKCADNEDYNHFDRLSFGGISYQCSKLFRQIRAEFSDGEISMDNGDFRAYAEANMNNPFFRLAMEMAGNTPDLAPASLRDSCRAVGERLNQLTMQKTLDPPSAEQKAVLFDKMWQSDARRELQKNRLEQLSLAKTMFMAHFGDFHTVGENGVNKPYTGSVTEAFAHGGRTFFCFGAGEPGENTVERTVFHDVRPGENVTDHGTALVSRIIGTHGVRTLDGEEGADAFREVKSGGSTKGLHAMNPAIGGIGNKFGNRIIENDGRNGHVFVKIQESTAKKGGYMMIGFEGEQSMTTGKTGHEHNLMAKKAKTSAFTAGKGAPGAEIGGRVVDLSIWGPEATGAIIGKFGEVYASLQADCENEVPGARERMAQINEKLTGNVMDREALVGFMRDDLGIASVNIKGANGSDREVSLDEMMDYRAANGKKHFDKLNKKAANADHRRAVREGLEAYSLGGELGGMSERLAQTRHIRFGKDQGDSKLMKNVKDSLDSVLELKEKGGYTPEEMKLRLAQLKVDSAKYLKERSAKNDRRAIVGEINAFVKTEMEVIDEHLGAHPERGYDEPQADVSAQVSQPDAAPHVDVL